MPAAQGVSELSIPIRRLDCHIGCSNVHLHHKLKLCQISDRQKRVLFNSSPAQKEIALYKSGTLVTFVFYRKFDLLVQNWSLFSQPIRKKLRRSEVESLNSYHPLGPLVSLVKFSDLCGDGQQTDRIIAVKNHT